MFIGSKFLIFQVYLFTFEIELLSFKFWEILRQRDLDDEFIRSFCPGPGNYGVRNAIVSGIGLLSVREHGRQGGARQRQRLTAPTPDPCIPIGSRKSAVEGHRRNS